MSAPEEPDIWYLLFEQLPPVVRWILGVLTLGLFSLAGMLWRWQVRNVERVEQQIHARMDREMRLLHTKLDETNKHLVIIARNTQGSSQ